MVYLNPIEHVGILKIIEINKLVGAGYSEKAFQVC